MALIVDLSSPQGHSVNDGIDPECWHLQCIKIDDIIKMVSKFGWVPSWLNLTLSLRTGILLFILRTTIIWAWSGAMPITLISPYHLGFAQLQQFSTKLRNWLSGFWSIACFQNREGLQSWTKVLTHLSKTNAFYRRPSVISKSVFFVDSQHPLSPYSMLQYASWTLWPGYNIEKGRGGRNVKITHW